MKERQINGKRDKSIKIVIANETERYLFFE